MVSQILMRCRRRSSSRDGSRWRRAAPRRVPTGRWRHGRARLPGLAGLACLLTVRSTAQVPVAPLLFESEVVVCESEPAARAGARILRDGGNAIDAAVATAMALAVTFPQAGNLGGGGFLIAFFPGSQEEDRRSAFDFREAAPARAHAEMFLGPDGEYSEERHHKSHLSVGVPGSVAGLGLAHATLGEISWEQVLQPAIGLARDGFVVSRGLSESLATVAAELRPRAAAGPFFPGGRPLQPGDTLVQPELAATLERIAAGGPREFYTGKTARLLVAEMERAGGWITSEDLTAYRAVRRSPLRGTYRGREVLSMPPPSSGGVALLQMLNILEGYDLTAAGPGSAHSIHLMTEAMRRAFADRARCLGDPDHVDVPVARLTSKEYARALRGTISSRTASASSPERFEWSRESDETTHISVVDRHGNAVSLTTTLEHSWGARIVVPGAGFLLNNEMGDFNPVPGQTSATGRIGTSPNLAAPGKRMVSSMTPAIILREGKLLAVVGSPGGRTIINSVLAVVVNLIDHDMRLQEAIDAPRVHHQWLPDTLWVEPGVSPDTIALLRSRGHRVERRDGAQGSVMAIRRVPATGLLEAGRDRRRPGGSAAGR